MRKHFLIGLFVLASLQVCASPALAVAPLGGSSAIPDPPIIRLQVPIGGATEITGGSAGITGYLAIIYQWLMRAAVVLSVLMFTIAGFMWITAGGESGQIKKAHGIIKNTIIGLVLAFGSYTILWNTNPKLVQPLNLNIDGIKEETITIEAPPPPSPVTPTATASIAVPTAAGQYATETEAQTQCASTCASQPAGKTQLKVVPHTGGTGFDCECIAPAIPATPAGAACDAGQLVLYPTGTDTPRNQCVSACNSANPFASIGLTAEPIQKTDTTAKTYYCCPCP